MSLLNGPSTTPAQSSSAGSWTQAVLPADPRKVWGGRAIQAVPRKVGFFWRPPSGVFLRLVAAFAGRARNRSKSWRCNTPWYWRRSSRGLCALWCCGEWGVGLMQGPASRRRCRFTARRRPGEGPDRTHNAFNAQRKSLGKTGNYLEVVNAVNIQSVLAVSANRFNIRIKTKSSWHVLYIHQVSKSVALTASLAALEETGKQRVD